MAINNCFYIKNISIAPVTIGNGLDPGMARGYDYSINNTTDWVAGDSFKFITLNPNDTVYFKGEFTWSQPDNIIEDWFFLRPLDETSPLELGGSIMSLLHNGDGNDESIVGGATFGGMFAAAKCPLHIDQLKLPSTLNRRYFRGMFRGCNRLYSIPTGLLPATQLTSLCYDSMFAQCSGLTSIPENLLPATELAEGCYSSMFAECSGLTTIPENLLPAKVLSNNCYSGMFARCYGITTVPEGIFCAEELADSCYSAMFSQAEGLKEIHFPFKEWGNYTTGWVWEIGNEGTFYCPIELPDEYGADRIPTGWKRIPPILTNKPFSATFLNKLKIGGRAK